MAQFFFAAVVLDPWACPAGGFGDCGMKWIVRYRWEKSVLVGVVDAILVDFFGFQILRIPVDFGGWQILRMSVTLPLVDLPYRTRWWCG